MKLRTMPTTVWAVPLLFVVLTLLAGCGEDGNGNDDTLLTGFSAVVILIIVGLLIWWAGRRHRR